jgi:N-acetylmuramoyl-L-alanine amidase
MECFLFNVLSVNLLINSLNRHLKVQSYKISSFLKIKTEVLYRFYAIFLFICLFTGYNYSFTQSKNKLTAIKTVCIDAGHGGKDPGCHGASVNEKTVCLNIALKLGAKIKEAYPDVKVIYTRDKDIFVELEERAQFANRNKADLFICIHANSASPSAFGAETYVLGLHRAGDQFKVAQRENSTIYLEDDKGEKYKNIDMSADAIIIRQLQLSVFLDHAILFATYVQSELKKLGRYDRGVKQDGFLVLRNTTMPAVLIETGFLTNTEEETFLANTVNQDKMAGAFFDAFRKYKAKMENVKFDESIEITAHTTNENTSKDEKLKIDSEQIFFKVQIETSDSKIPLSSSKFKGLDVYEYKQDNLFKYAVGNFENNFEEANVYKNELRNKGFPHAFVIAIQNGERIPIDKALKLLKK